MRQTLLLLTYVLAFFTILHFTHSQYSPKCQESLNDAFNSIKSGKVDFSNPYLASGWGINDMGKYDTCLSNANNTFLMVKMNYTVTTDDNFTSTIPMYLGQCAPNYCANANDKAVLKQKVINTTGFKEEEVLVFSSREENEYNKSFNFTSGFIFTILIIYLLFGLGIVKVIHECLFSKKKSSSSPREINPSVPYSSLGEDSSNRENNNLREGQEVSSNAESSDNPVRQEKEEKPSTFQVYLYGCFDFKTNVAKIFELRQTEDTELKMWDGIRFLACGIVVLCHCVTLIDQIPIRNPETAYDYFKSFGWQIIYNGSFAVDVFFSLSGFFMSYIGVKRIADIKTGALKKLGFAILMRFLRIWPVYVFVFFIYWRFFVYTLDGPLSGYIFNKELDSCSYQWPFLLTLLSNFTYGIWEIYYPYCASWYWYIPNDFQLSVMGTFLLMFYSKRKMIFYCSIAVINIGFMVVESVQIYVYNFDSINSLQLGQNEDYYKKFYMKIWNRGVPFFIGYLFGVLYAEYKVAVKEEEDNAARRLCEKIKNSKVLSFIFWFVGVFLILFINFVTHWNYGEKWPFFVCYLYNFLSRKLFIFGMFIFSLPIMLGNFYILGG